jgi:hypothetical protein
MPGESASEGVRYAVCSVIELPACDVTAVFVLLIGVEEGMGHSCRRGRLAARFPKQPCCEDITVRTLDMGMCI